MFTSEKLEALRARYAGAGAGELRNPTGIAVGGDRVYVADALNRRVQVFAHDGTFVRTLGGPAVEAQGVSAGAGGRPRRAGSTNSVVKIA